MTEVWTVPPRGRTSSFQSALRRTSSHPVLIGAAATASSYHLNHSSIRSPFLNPEFASESSASAHSSPSASPQFSAVSFADDHSSIPSTPASTPASTPGGLFNLDSKHDFDVEGDFQQRPFLDGGDSFSDDDEDDDDEVHHVENAGPRDLKSPVTDASSSTDTLLAQLSLTENQELPRSAGDDSAIEIEPTRHVDYLSHDWQEEDIWSSWRYVVSRRKEYNNSVRLENATWRTWIKSKYGLKTVSPDELNWLKESDVTWLYGPLQTTINKTLEGPPKATPPPSQLSHTGSFLKKPILKRKSTSEAILQRSLSAHALLKHAGAILQAQEADRMRSPRPSLAPRAQSDFGHSPSIRLQGSEDYSTDTSTALSSLTSSGLQSPGERRHISFNNEVVQCIAIDNKGADDDDDEIYDHSDADSDSDDEAVVMMKVSSKSRINSISTPRSSFASNDSVTIKPLPPTTLKYREDTPEPGSSKTPTFANPWSNPSSSRLSPSPSQETLRPSRSTTNFLLPEDDDDADEVLDWQPRWNDMDYTNPVDPQHAESSSRTGESGVEGEGRGLRLTSSGMFMPYDGESEEAAIEAGLFGKVVDTVNTARDIAHVIWNVGWRR